MYLEQEQIEEIGEYVGDNVDAITNALNVYADHMNESVKVARTEYERGQGDPAVKAEQDRSMVTNAGYRMAAEMGHDSAVKARQIAQKLTELAYGDD